MNIFFLDESPIQSAEWLHDRHVMSQINESGQLLSTWAFLVHGKIWHKPIAMGNAIVKWLFESTGNVQWLHIHLANCIAQYDHRYGADTTKYSKARMISNQMNDLLHSMEFEQMTLPVLAMPPEYRANPYESLSDATWSYRRYYQAEKFNISCYTKMPVPYWIYSDLSCKPMATPKLLVKKIKPNLLRKSDEASKRPIRALKVPRKGSA